MSKYLFFLLFYLHSAIAQSRTYDDCLAIFEPFLSSSSCSGLFECNVLNIAPYLQLLKYKAGVSWGSLSSCFYSGDDSCPAGQSRPTTKSVCSSTAATCSASEYDLGGTCTPIPDCNADTQGLGGKYFDHGTKGCAQGDHVICITASSVNTQYCPPNSDCQLPGTICSNDPTAVAAAQAEKAANLAVAQARADAAVARAVAAAEAAKTPLAAAQQAKTLATTNANAAQAALNAAMANPSSTSAQKSAAAQAYGNALNALTDAATRLAAIEKANSDADAAKDSASGHAGNIPTAITSGHGQKEADDAESDATNGEGFRDDAIAGGGSGSGSTIGQGSGTGITSEGIAKGVRDGLATSPGVSLGSLGHGSGTGKGNGTGTDTDGDGECDVDCGEDTDGDGQCDVNCGVTPGNFNESLADAEDALNTGRDRLNDKMSEIRTGVSSIFGSSITNGNGSLPIVEFGTLKGVHVVLDMNAHAEQLGIISAIIMALAWLSALSIILSR